jgi:hypothetical protein
MYDFPRRPGATQAVAYTGTSAAASNAFGTETYFIRVVANSACHVKIGDGAQTATTSDPFLLANWESWFAVTPGQSIAFVRAASDGLVTATSGTAWVTEMS